MDDQAALRIITALANGAHPTSGEVFGADSPYQAPEIIRALFTASRALESKLSGRAQGVRSQTSATNPTIGNAGKPWNAEEDRQLLAGFDAGKSLPELAQVHARSQGGIRARLEKHGRLEPSPASRWPVNGPKPSEGGTGARRQYSAGDLPNPR